MSFEDGRTAAVGASADANADLSLNIDHDTRALQLKKAIEKGTYPGAGSNDTGVVLQRETREVATKQTQPSMSSPSL